MTTDVRKTLAKVEVRIRTAPIHKMAGASIRSK